MIWVLLSGGASLVSYILGYFIGKKITEEKFLEPRKELQLDDECYGCKEIGLPCDPKCKFRKENEDEQSEKNNSEEKIS